MAVARDRVVLFRVTADEFKAIEHAAEMQGARSVSSYVRSAVMEKDAQEDARMRANVLQALKEYHGG